MAALRGSAMVLLQQQALSVPMWGCTIAPAAMCKQLKLLSDADRWLITFSTLFFSIFITVKQANAAFAGVCKSCPAHPSV